MLRSHRQPRTRQQTTGRTIRWHSAHQAEDGGHQGPANPGRIIYPRRELINRLTATRCELCKQIDEVHVHHVRTLAELDASDPTPWTKVMTKRRRKTLVVCADCHDRIHGTTPATTFTA